jgi:hypothetical protein
VEGQTVNKFVERRVAQGCVEIIPVYIRYIGTLEMVRTTTLLFYDSICQAEGFGLFLAKDCDRIAALTLCKQNIPSSFRP